MSFKPLNTCSFIYFLEASTINFSRLNTYFFFIDLAFKKHQLLINKFFIVPIQVIYRNFIVRNNFCGSDLG